MNLKDYKTHFIKTLLQVVDEDEATQFFYIALEELMQLRRVDLVMKEVVLTEKEQLKWNEVLAELLTHKPIQYIFGKTHFYGLEFFVNENTLIPRPETEELVEWILNTVAAEPEKQWRILDIGTGSGCIPISLAKNIPNAIVHTMDVSAKAIEVAQKNATLNQVNVTFLLRDVLQADRLEAYDIIVSNPPYVRELEKEEILPNVLAYEPHLALFVEDHDALIFYRKIVALADAFLAEKGYLFFEINQYLGTETLALFEHTRFKDIALRKDLQGNDRMIKAN